MPIYIFLALLLVLITIGAIAVYCASKRMDKELHELAEEGRRKGVKPIDDY